MYKKNSATYQKNRNRKTIKTMSDDLMPFDLPIDRTSIIKVVGVGGGGSNAVNHMYKQGIKDVNFVVCNTDSQALANSPVPLKIQLGESLTEGRGAGNKPERGKQAAIESIENVVQSISENTKMVFITAGMGGGTGTGAAPIIAKATKDLGILTVGIVTIPFRFEGKRRVSQAIDGIKELSQHVDSLIVINNEKLREIYGDLKISEAFSNADNILTVAAKGIAEIITVHGHLNVDFADVQTVMSDSGVALMGSAQASGEGRALKAIEEALNSPLLNNNDIKGAKNILLNISSGTDEATMDEIGEINDFVQEAAGFTADLIWGNTKDEKLGDKISVTVIATGFKTDVIHEMYANQETVKEIHSLDKKKETKQEKIIFEVEDRKNNDSFLNKPFAFSDNKVKEEPREKKTVPVSNKAYVFDEPFESDEELNSTAKNFIEKISQTSKTKTEYSQKTYLTDIDRMEKEPAYKRKELKLDDYGKPKNEISRFSISNENGEIRIKENNSYLHDRAD